MYRAGERTSRREPTEKSAVDRGVPNGARGEMFEPQAKSGKKLCFGSTLLLAGKCKAREPDVGRGQFLTNYVRNLRAGRHKGKA